VDSPLHPLTPCFVSPYLVLVCSGFDVYSEPRLIVAKDLCVGFKFLVMDFEVLFPPCLWENVCRSDLVRPFWGFFGVFV
jgi:hypothetical protein